MAGWRTIDGEKLRHAREDQMLSQRDLMKLTGISQATISALETGARKAQPRTVRKLAEALGVEVRDLLKERDE
jgi:transcriptional regulator with XRE-family HTH domain